jgi:NAD(P)-dependent dehydrogenase (short-subunit alcohol dehydrogenase family)
MNLVDGSVIVGSSSDCGWPFPTSYSASKAGLQAATVSIDREIRERGVRVVSVEIGSTAATGFGSAFDPATVEAAARAWTRCGIPWDEAIATPQQSAAKIIDVLERALAGGGGG